MNEDEIRILKSVSYVKIMLLAASNRLMALEPFGDLSFHKFSEEISKLTIELDVAITVEAGKIEDARNIPGLTETLFKAFAEDYGSLKMAGKEMLKK